MKLTKRAVDGLVYQGRPPRGADVRWDDELRGFGMRIHPSGRKTFLIQYRAHRRTRQMVIGPYGVFTVDQARDLARAHLAAVHAQGRDPAEERRRGDRGASMGELCEVYMDRHGARKKTSAEDRRRLDMYILPRWRARPAASITRSDVAALHHQLGGHSIYTANRTLSLLGTLFERARAWGYLEEAAPNPARGIARYRERRRDRWVSPGELPALAMAIDQADNLYVRAALWLYLLTGMRKNELLSMRWADVDLERREVRLPDTKAGRIHYVPLSRPATQILAELPRLQGNPHVLPGRYGRGHLVNIDKPWDRVRTQAGIPDVRLHDLRRTVGSWLAESGASLHLIGHILGHSTVQTTAVYARFGEHPARRALEEHGARIMAAAGKAKGGEVVELRKPGPRVGEKGTA